MNGEMYKLQVRFFIIVESVKGVIIICLSPEFEYLIKLQLIVKKDKYDIILNIANYKE